MSDRERTVETVDTTEPTLTRDDLAALVESAKASVAHHDESIEWCDAIARDVEAGVPRAEQALRDANLALERLPFVRAETDDETRQLSAAREAVSHAEDNLGYARVEAHLARAAVEALYGPRQEARNMLADYQHRLDAPARKRSAARRKS